MCNTGPSGLYPPEVTAVSSTSLNVTWREPQTPNGVITNYSIFDTTTSGDLDSLLTFSSSPAYLIVDGLDPFTEYGFVVEVCTAVGCNDSQVGTGQTGESGKYIHALFTTIIQKFMAAPHSSYWTIKSKYW